MKVVLALGSNKGDRQKNIFRAIRELSERKLLSNITCSTFFENAALLLPNSPSNWNCDFINCVIVGDSVLELDDIFDAIQDIEKFLGRQIGAKWSPREIDIDILYYGDLVIHSSKVSVPHIGILARNFVLLPLKEIMPKFKHCGRDKYYNFTIEEIVKDKYGL